MTKKYCKGAFFIAILFIAVFVIDNGYGSSYFLFYPCILASTVPATLLAYDERCKWNLYCDCLPYARSQVVSGKYLTGLIFQAAMLVFSALALAIKMHKENSFALHDFLLLSALLLATSLLSSSVTLPLMFQWGSEKGRLLYLPSMVILVFFIGFFLTGADPTDFSLNAPLLCSAAILLYVLSWRISVMIYKRKEIR